ncbi:MAG TPA: hypothetical protein VFK50_09225 [Sphingomicrobium sp.]|nr:hypothetical protein [Sphingomicrobium sp.]
MAEWFAAKRYGIGAGLPVSWQGWAVLLVYAATVLGALLLLGERNPATFAILLISTAILLVVTARTTRGGWRWRWGEPG